MFAFNDGYTVFGFNDRCTMCLVLMTDTLMSLNICLVLLMGTLRIRVRGIIQNIEM